MKAKFLAVLMSAALATTLVAKTCREVVRDSSGRIVQTIDRQKSAGGTVQATQRDGSSAPRRPAQIQEGPPALNTATPRAGYGMRVNVRAVL